MHAAAPAKQEGTLPSLGSSKLQCCAAIFLFKLEPGASCRLISLVPDPTLHVRREKDPDELYSSLAMPTQGGRIWGNTFSAYRYHPWTPSSCGSVKHLIPRIPSKAMAVSLTAQ